MWPGDLDDRPKGEERPWFAKGAPDASPPKWATSADPSAQPSDGYFRLIGRVEPQGGQPSAACVSSGDFWHKEQASYGVAAKPVDFEFWTKDIEYPVYERATTFEDSNVCTADLRPRIIVPFHPLDRAPSALVEVGVLASNQQRLRLTEYMTAASGIAGALAGLAVPGASAVTAFAARETTTTAMGVLDDAYAAARAVSLDHVQSIPFSRVRDHDVRLPLHYFKGDSQADIQKALDSGAKDSRLLDIRFYLEFRRSIIGLEESGELRIPTGHVDRASDYLTTPSAGAGKSFLQLVSETYPSMIDGLSPGKDPRPACREIRERLQQAAYSASDQAALYGSLLVVANGGRTNFLTGSTRFRNPDCFPVSSANAIGSRVRAVFPNQLAYPTIDHPEFTRETFDAARAEVYDHVLSDFADALRQDTAAGAGGYVRPWLREPVSVSSAGDVAASVSAGDQPREGAIATLAGLPVATAGCFAPAELVGTANTGPRLVFTLKDRPTELLMLTLFLDASDSVYAFDVRPADQATRLYVRPSKGNFWSESQCVAIARAAAP